jgi:hypothetical protein
MGVSEERKCGKIIRDLSKNKHINHKNVQNKN